MIVGMKRVFIVVQEKDAAGAVGTLRRCGVLHVENVQLPQGTDLAFAHEQKLSLESALSALSAILPRNALPQPRPAHDPQVIAGRIIERQKRIDHLKEYSRTVMYQSLQWEPWGDFDPASIARLAEKNIFVRLYQIPVKEFDRLPAGLTVRKISLAAGMVNCVVVSRTKDDIGYKEVPIPKMGLAQMRERLAQDAQLIAQLETEQENDLSYAASLKESLVSLEKDIEFYQALRGMGQKDGFTYIGGFVPLDAVSLLEKAAADSRWGLLVRDPLEDETVPTCLRNPGWVKLVTPVFDLLGITPGYRELDVSMVFLIFFSVFFGILIGDAGYGMVYLGLTIWFRKKVGNKGVSSTIFRLLYLLSASAIVWGLLSGTFFGQAWIARLGLRPLVPQVNDIKFMQSFCFFLGALHLSIAHGWRAILKMPALSFLADIGWICVLWTAFFLARTLILGEPCPGVVRWLIIAGLSLVIFFTNPQRNLFKTIGEGLGTVALSLMNNFTDVVSYVRLFAVGLAGVAIAETTNSMAAGLGTGPVAIVAGALIVVIGHALNIVLGPMSVLVHGVRLNVLEFSGHASVSWSGISYQPLKE